MTLAEAVELIKLGYPDPGPDRSGRYVSPSFREDKF